MQPTPVPNWLVARVKAASDADTRVKAASDADTSRLCLITSIVMLERRNGVAGLLHGHLRSTMSSKDQEGRRHHVRRHIAGAQAGAARLKLGLHDSIFSGLRHGEYPGTKVTLGPEISALAAEARGAARQGRRGGLHGLRVPDTYKSRTRR